MFCHAVKSGQFHRNFYIERVADRLNINQQNFNLVRPTFGEWVARTLPTFSDKPLSVVPVPHARMLALGDGTIAGQDLRHAEFIDGADLLIHDAQYTAEEYPEKVGWGHSPVEYVVKLARYARVKRVALTHHDPLRMMMRSNA
jgi:Beta-lactamase superfamily domain